VRHQGETFHLVRGNPFSYRVVGNVLNPNRTNRNIPRSNFEKALALLPLKSTTDLKHLQGPSYIYAILTDRRIIPDETAPAETAVAEEATQSARVQTHSRKTAASPDLASSTVKLFDYS